MATIVVTGRLGKDCELRSLQSGTKVVQFSVADDVGFGDKKTRQWLKCAMFGARAEKLAQYLVKGTLVEVCGTPSTEAWIDKGTGAAKSTIAVNVLEVRLHGGNKSTEAEAPKRREAPPSDDDENGIPF